MVCEPASSKYVMEGHTPWESQETTKMVETVVEEEVVGDNATSASTTFDVFENVDLVMSESIPSPDNLVDVDVVVGAFEKFESKDLVMGDFVPPSDQTSRSLLVPIHLLDDDQEDDADELKHPDMLPSDLIRLENFYWHCKPKLQTEDSMWDTRKMRSAKQLLGAVLGTLHVKPLTLKRYRRKDRAWRFKAISKHSREIIRKQQPCSSRIIGKPFDPGKLEEHWDNEGTENYASRDRKPTRCAGVDLGVRAPRFTHIRAAGIDRSVSFVNKMSFRLNHQFLQFPEGLDRSVEFASRRDALVGRRVLEATIIDRDILKDAGIWGEIEPFLHCTWTHGDASFTCRGWDRLMANQEDIVYTELLLEFLSTVCFAPRSTEALSRLGQPARAANAEVWAPLSNVFYEAGTSKESHLRDPLHRLMHRIVSTSIMHKEGARRCLART
ncbi:hypothetical protein L2E82_48716 [Cichorium intybus]|uniref:Uncharacterized protein n=1 Tax=Cichorium intybus TaxID=13427 RepID=A0ACB8YXX6_CICIN|nr:hypothetical protein L2E82_48716 [Cichorium intybus]